MGVLGVLGNLGELGNLYHNNFMNRGEAGSMLVEKEKGNFENLPESLRVYGVENLAGCYSPQELTDMGKKQGLRGMAETAYKGHIWSEKNYQERLSGGVQLMSLVYCSFFNKDQLKEKYHKILLKSLQGLELETLIVDEAIDNPEKYKDVGLRAVNGRIIYSAVTEKFIDAVSEINIPEKNKMQMIKVWNNTLGYVYAGQAIDLINTGTVNIKLEEYLHMVTNTTARFVQMPAIWAGTIKEEGKEELEIMANYGLNLGIAFQIRDDWEDMEKDITERKPRAFAINESWDLLNPETRKDLEKIYLTEPLEAIRIIVDSKIPDYVRGLNHKYLDNAKIFAGKIKQKEISKRLIDIIEILVI
ncbi:MAG: polyprenyl synthetase family protein [Candidatus Nanoarchaeia archaeon]